MEIHGHPWYPPGIPPTFGDTAGWFTLGCSWETISVWWPLPIRRAKLLKLLTARPLGPGTSVSKFGKANTEYLGMRTETY